MRPLLAALLQQSHHTRLSISTWVIYNKKMVKNDPCCWVRLLGFKTPCSCCNGSLTFCKAQRFVDSLVPLPEQLWHHVWNLPCKSIPQCCLLGTGDDRHEKRAFRHQQHHLLDAGVLAFWDSVIGDLIDLVDQRLSQLLMCSLPLKPGAGELKAARFLLHLLKLPESLALPLVTRSLPLAVPSPRAAAF